MLQDPFSPNNQISQKGMCENENSLPQKTLSRPKLKFRLH